MKKNISFLIAELFKDKDIFLDMGFSNVEADIFFYLIKGYPLSRIAETLQLPLTTIRKIKDRRFHLVPVFIRRKMGYLNSRNVNKLNNLLGELNGALNDYFNYFEKSNTKRIRELNVSERTINALFAQNIKTIEELTELNSSELLSIKNIGKKGLEEIKMELGKLGLGVRNEE